LPRLGHDFLPGGQSHQNVSRETFWCDPGDNTRILQDEGLGLLQAFKTGSYTTRSRTTVALAPFRSIPLATAGQILSLCRIRQRS